MPLTNLNTDQNSIKTELENSIKGNPNLGNSLFPSDAIEMITELMSGIISGQIYRIETAVLNNYMTTAFIPSSIYNIAKMTGGSPRRKVGASMKIRITPQSTLTQNIIIPKESSFSFKSLFWYNKEDIIMTPTTEFVESYLYEGEKILESYFGNGQKFQRIKLGSKNFSIEEESINVTIDSINWSREKDSLIKYKNSTSSSVFVEETLADGSVLLKFGDGIYGDIPSINSSINVSYFKNNGINGNSSSINESIELNSQIYLPDSSLFQPTIINITKPSGGDEEESSDLIKFTSPRLFSANKRSIRRDDYIGFLSSYPGVLSCKAWGEYEETRRRGRNDPETRNSIYISLLKENNEKKESTLGQIQTSTNLYNFTIPDLNVIKGSLSIEIGNKKDRFYSSKNYLFSNNQYINSLQSNIVSTSASSQDLINTSDKLVDNNQETYFSSITYPSALSPIHISIELLNQIDVGSIRIQAANVSDYNDRASPKTFFISGSTLSSPNINLDSDWEVIKGYTNIKELNSREFTDWIEVNTYPNNYRHIRISIVDKYGNSNSVKIGEIQIQKHSDLSIFDFSNSSLSLKTQTNNFVDGDEIKCSYYISDYSTLEIDSIVNYFEDKKHMNTNLVYISPIFRVLDIEANVFYTNATQNPNSLASELESKLRQFYEIKIDSIGRNFKLSDIYERLTDEKEKTGVDYVNVKSPISDIPLDFNEVIIIRNVTINMFRSVR